LGHEWAVWLTVTASILVGLLLQAVALGRTETASSGGVAGVSLSYPARWVPVPVPDATFAAADLNNGGPFGARVSVSEVPVAQLIQRVSNDREPLALATSWTLVRGEAIVGYRLLGLREELVQGRPAAVVEYAYLADAPGGPASGALPAVMRATDVLIPVGAQVHLLTFAAQPQEYERLTHAQFPRPSSTYASVLRSWRLPD